jgi:hypothetical protein
MYSNVFQSITADMPKPHQWTIKKTETSTSCGPSLLLININGSIESNREITTCSTAQTEVNLPNCASLLRTLKSKTDEFLKDYYRQG